MLKLAGLPLERFEPIGLAELVDTAPLMTRVDRKYVLSAAQARTFLDALPANTLVLEHSGRRQSRYETCYFDTPDLAMFHMCARSRRIRLKVRTRTYSDDCATFLEAKSRNRPGITVKRRVPYRYADRDHLTCAGTAYAAHSMTEAGLPPGSDLEITLTSAYRRTTLLAPGADTRVTIDTDLAWWLPDGRHLDAPGLVIVETKSRSGASDADRTLWHAGIRPTSVSKYATGLAALRPELPRNQWSRLLNGPLHNTLERQDPNHA